MSKRKGWRGFGIALGILALVGVGALAINAGKDKAPKQTENPTSSIVETTQAATEGKTEFVTETELLSTAPEETEQETALAVPEVTSGSTFEIWYLDVGQGDAICVSCDGHSMLFDGGERRHSDLMYSFLKSHSISTLDCVVASHPDADHIGGLAGALNYAKTSTAYCTTTEHDTDTFANFKKYLDVPITIPAPGDAFLLGSAKVTFLYPDPGRTQSDNTSIALMIEYGTTSFLFAGDCEKEDESVLLRIGYDLSATVLKVSHHGSASSSTEAFLKAVDPDYAVISVGGDNTYGHPAEEVLQRLKSFGVTTYRTDMHGTVHCTSDGKTVRFDVESDPGADVFSAAGGYDNYLEAQKQAEEASRAATTGSSTGTLDYIVNINTGKFHTPGCSSVSQMKESNKWYYTGTRDELIAQGYDPCQKCNP